MTITSRDLLLHVQESIAERGEDETASISLHSIRDMLLDLNELAAAAAYFIGAHECMESACPESQRLRAAIYRATGERP